MLPGKLVFAQLERGPIWWTGKSLGLCRHFTVGVRNDISARDLLWLDELSSYNTRNAFSSYSRYHINKPPFCSA